MEKMFKIKKSIIEQRGVKSGWTREPIQKRSWKCIVEGLRNDFQEYCEATSLHGFRYITSDEATCAAKFLWLVVCLMSSTLSVYLMLTVWNEYTMTPAVISVESTTYPLWGFSFPAVTICNFNKVYKPRADEVAEKMKLYGMNDSEIRYFFDELPALINKKDSKKDFHRVIEYLTRIGSGPESFMYNLMQPCHKLLTQCFWHGVKYNCSEIFKTVKTSQGYCCGFNYHVLQGAYPLDGHSMLGVERSNNTSDYPGVFEPLMIPGSGRGSGLYVLINVESNTYRASVKRYFGSAVLIHDPLVYPEINLQSIDIQPGQEITIYLKGSVIESEESLRSLSLKQRKCFFDDEVKLNTTSQYRYGACITECRMEYIYARCGCVPYFYPSTMDEVRSCGLLDLPCMKEHINKLALLEDSKNGQHPDWPRDSVKCRHECLPQCTDKSYSLTTASAYFMPEQMHKKSNISKKPSLASFNKTAVEIHFPDITCLKYRRETVMTWENLLAAFGGIFALCIGGSFVSLVEIAYFLAICIFRMQKVENSEKPMTIYKREISGPMRNQPQVETKQLNIGWNNDDFPKQLNFNKSLHTVPKTMLNIQKQESNKIAFTIDVSGYKSVN